MIKLTSEEKDDLFEATMTCEIHCYDLAHSEKSPKMRGMTKRLRRVAETLAEEGPGTLSKKDADTIKEGMKYALPYYMTLAELEKQGGKHHYDSGVPARRVEELQKALEILERQDNDQE